MALMQIEIGEGEIQVGNLKYPLVINMGLEILQRKQWMSCCSVKLLGKYTMEGRY